MTTLPEEAVKAAMDEFNRTRRFMTSDTDRIYAAIAAALPHLPQGVDEREAVLNYKAKLRVAFRKALSDLPEIAPTEIASILSSVHMQDEFWKEGKRLQLEHGLDAVAPRVEQECGAGAWSFIRKGILSAREPSAARELALEEIIALCRDYGEDSQPDSEYRLACNDIIEAIQERRALSSLDHADASKVEGDGWKPIDLSTPDNTWLLVYVTGHGVVTARRKPFYGWISLNGKLIKRATHWHPLPASPGAPK